MENVECSLLSCERFVFCLLSAALSHRRWSFCQDTRDAEEILLSKEFVMNVTGLFCAHDVNVSDLQIDERTSFVIFFL